MSKTFHSFTEKDGRHVLVVNGQLHYSMDRAEGYLKPAIPTTYGVFCVYNRFRAPQHAIQHNFHFDEAHVDTCAANCAINHIVAAPVENGAVHAEFVAEPSWGYTSGE